MVYAFSFYGKHGRLFAQLFLGRQSYRWCGLYDISFTSSILLFFMERRCGNETNIINFTFITLSLPINSKNKCWYCEIWYNLTNCCCSFYANKDSNGIYEDKTPK